ncbi:Uma2 family endonuclease [Thiothrix nivea]|uniref:Putative restriction endonuclease domain-containing protein n=1 Tax=Thiothrix nivea (strain ATCC 35100 / DSM 5205 / JP2) TaxID=870187 RepID=A0A656HKR2_THINJ|nr:Uma2 family endonuclease [Thiothrix nivea]EIJ35890.1 protein of unknown function DUF820 [Thiothrix nivea DSM 5205]
MTAAEKLKERFTYGDYRQWPQDERWELIDGVAYMMAAPSRLHQLFAFEMGFQIRAYLADRRCSVYSAPFDIRLPKQDEADDDVDTTVQPDVAVICDRNKLDDKGCRGAPDWAIEVLSPSTAIKDMDTKRQLYEKHGVKEYWIVHPTDHWLMIYTLNDGGQYNPHPHLVGLEEPTPVGLFPDLSIDWGFTREA